MGEILSLMLLSSHRVSKEGYGGVIEGLSLRNHPRLNLQEFSKRHSLCYHRASTDSYQNKEVLRSRTHIERHRLHTNQRICHVISFVKFLERGKHVYRQMIYFGKNLHRFLYSIQSQ